MRYGHTILSQPGMPLNALLAGNTAMSLPGTMGALPPATSTAISAGAATTSPRPTSLIEVSQHFPISPMHATPSHTEETTGTKSALPRAQHITMLDELRSMAEAYTGLTSNAASAAVDSGRHFIAGARDWVNDPKTLALQLGLAATLSVMMAGCNLNLDPETSAKLPGILKDAILFKTLGGLGIFFLGLDLMEKGLKAASADKVRAVLTKLTTNRFAGLATGTLGTATWQSSSVTTVMLVGLVSAGLMSLEQALPVVFGANIGTTMTGWLFAIKLTKYALPIIFTGMLMNLFIAKKFESTRIENIGKAVLGIGLVFQGLNTMSSGFKDPVVKEVLKSAFTLFAGESHANILACIVIAMIATEIVQSSSATLGVIIALATTGVIPFETAVGLVLGINIGTTITAVMAAFKPGTPRAAQRVAMAHVGFNLIGAAIVFGVAPQYIHGIASITKEMGMTDIAKQVAFSHTAFNVIMSALFIGAVGPYGRLINRLRPDLPEDQEAKRTALSPALLNSPVFALSASRKEILDMSHRVWNMMVDLDALYEALSCSGKVPKKQIEEIKGRIDKAEDVLDEKQTAIFEWLTDVIQRAFGEKQAHEIDVQRTIADQLETISDRLRDTTQRLVKWQSKPFGISPAALHDLKDLHGKMSAFLQKIHQMLAANGDAKGQESWKELVEMRSALSDLIKKLEKRHNKRLRKNIQQEVRDKITALETNSAPPPPPTTDLDAEEDKNVMATPMPDDAEEGDNAKARISLPLIKVEAPESRGSTYHMDILSFYRSIVDRAINIADALAGKR